MAHKILIGFLVYDGESFTYFITYSFSAFAERTATPPLILP